MKRALLVALCLAMSPALAEKDLKEGIKEGAEKTGKGFGNLLRGMGQELKKAGGTLTGGAKKADKKEKAKEEKPK